MRWKRRGLPQDLEFLPRCVAGYRAGSLRDGIGMIVAIGFSVSINTPSLGRRTNAIQRRLRPTRIAGRRSTDTSEIGKKSAAGTKGDAIVRVFGYRLAGVCVACAGAGAAPVRQPWF